MRCCSKAERRSVEWPTPVPEKRRHGAQDVSRLFTVRHMTAVLEPDDFSWARSQSCNPLEVAERTIFVAITVHREDGAVQTAEVLIERP